MVVNICAGMAALLLAALGWWRRHEAFGAGVYTVAALAACVWCWSIAAVDVATTPDHYPYALVGLWLASVSACVASVFVMARRAVKPRWSPPRPVVAIFIVEPVAIFVLQVTNPLHELVGTQPDGVQVFGIAYQLHAAYCIGLVLAVAASLATRKGQAGAAQRRQITTLQGLIVAVIIVEISQLGLTQYIAVAGLAVLFRSMFGQGLNELVPVTRGAAIDQMSDFVFFFDTAGRLVDMNSPATLIMGSATGQPPLVGTSAEDVFGVPLPLDEATDTFVVLGEGPDAVQAIARCTPLSDDGSGLVGWLVIARHEADHPVHHDPVTGLLTRAQLDQVLRRSVSGASEATEKLSVALLDVDGFKTINDTHGHVTGDEVLNEIARRIDQATDGSATIGRFGGDEFVAVFVGQAAEEAARLAEAMRSSVAASPMQVGGALVDVTITVGVAQYAGGSVAELIGAADAAMYAAKRAGRNRVQT